MWSSFPIYLENSSELSRGVILDRSHKKIMYLSSVILNFNNSRTKKSLFPWNSILNTDIPPNEIYGHIYEKPQSMHEGDLNWRIRQSSPVGQPSSKASCPARGLTPANQTSPRISCPVQMNQPTTPAD